MRAESKAKTRRGHGSGAVYQTASGKWEAMLDLGYIPGPDGKKRRKRVKRVRDTERAAIEALDELKRQHHLGTLQTTKNPRLGDYLREWFDAQGPARWKPTSTRAHRTSLNRCIEALGHIRLDQLRAGHVEHMLNQLAATYARNTISGAVAVLRMALKDAVRDGLVARNVATDARMPRHVAKPATAARFMTESELQRFLAAAHDHRDGPLFVLAVTTGLRLGELRGLTWDDVDMDAGMLTVRRQLQDNTSGGGWQFTTPKTESSVRTLPLPATARAVLKRQHRHQLEERVLAGSKWRDHGFVFTAQHGQPVQASRVHHALKAVLSAASVPDLRVHDLRHCFASYLIHHGADLLTVRDLCGHASIKQTADTYSHLFPSRKVEAMAAWDALEDMAS